MKVQVEISTRQGREAPEGGQSQDGVSPQVLQESTLMSDIELLDWERIQVCRSREGSPRKPTQASLGRGGLLSFQEVTVIPVAPGGRGRGGHTQGAPGKCHQRARGSSLRQEPWRGLWDRSREAGKRDEINKRDGTRARGRLDRSHSVAHHGGELETCQGSNCKGLETIVQC